MPRRSPALATVIPAALADDSSPDQRTSCPRPTAAVDRRQADLRQQTIRRSLVGHAAVEVARSRAFSSIVWAHDPRVRPEGLSDAEWACVCLRDADPGTPAHLIAVALCCSAADDAERRGSR